MPSASTLESRNTLIYLFLALLIIDTILIILSQDLWAIGRIIFTAIIMYFVLQGYRWAKWMLVSTLSLVVIAQVGLIAALGNQISAILSIGSVAMAILCIILMAYLVGNNDLKRYFALKQQRRLG
ncbi:hypothetical protein [Leptothoe kymatousa]|uniref:Uncharacterized protein n=1 Tax=Leptothoe kymatousa TAU-MAC 1615 TaxID=2364775 RepID=A0ABS5Y2N3_9CYAN|nr:hypothetical protein [Leptothoe kymatousa]MBT9312075.1 hypothetical protein [Leptothoe kymatousa TAU-MAC 1615]